MLWLIIWGILLSIVFYYYCIRPMSYWKKRGIKQSDPAWVFGDTINMILNKESLTDIVIRLYNLYPKDRYHGIYQFTLPTLLVKDPELIKQITVKDFDHFLDHRTFIPEEADPLWGKNLFALKGQRWRQMRPVLSPTFTGSKMKIMFQLMDEVVTTFVDYYKDKQGDSNGVIEVEMKDALTRYGNDVIASAIFGVKVDSLKNRDNQFYLMGKKATNFNDLKTVMKMFGYSSFPTLYSLFKITLFGPDVKEFFLGLVGETIKIREEQSIVRPDMINLLLEARKGIQKNEDNVSVEAGFATVQEADLGKASDYQTKEITDLDITAHSLIFFFAGFDGVTTVMTFMAYELAIHPDIQSRLRKEIEETDQQCKGKLTYEILMRMKYMDMVVSETLRKWPIAVAADRVCTKPYTIEPVIPGEKPLLIQKGELIWIPISGIHMDPKYYPEPEKFDPERFNDENKHKINPYTYLPFGVGPRNCIGSRFALMECKSLFYHLLLNFEIVPVKNTPIPLKLIKAAFNVTPQGGTYLGLKPIRK